MSRKCKDMGNPMLVKLPSIGYEDTGEGGMAFFLVVCQRSPNQRRQTCMAGDILCPLQDYQLPPKTFPWFEGEDNLDYTKHYLEPIDAGLLIGSTGQSLWSDEKEFYFTAKLSDLTPEGKGLYHLLKSLYGSVIIVTLLDT